MIGALINRLAKGAQSSGQPRIFARETRTGADVGEIENQIAHRITFILQRGGDGESFAGLEKTKNHTAPRRFSIVLNQIELSPGVGGRGDNLDRLIMLQFRAIPASQRQGRALRRVEQSLA